MLKIVLVLLENDYGRVDYGTSYEKKAFLSAFKKLGCEVYPFWYDKYLDKIDALQKKVKEYIDSINPDVVFFCLYKDQFSTKTLEYLKEKYKTINWFGDDHWRFEDFTKRFAPHFSYCITTDKFALKKYNDIGVRNVILSQWAAYEIVEEIDFNKKNYSHDVSFIGSYNPNREWIIKELEKREIKVFHKGLYWPDGKIDSDEMRTIFNRSKICLNLSNSKSHDIRCILSSRKAFMYNRGAKKNAEQIKARHFEIPALGGFQLSNLVPFIEDYFEVGKEIALYTDVDDLELRIKYYLENESERIRILKNSYKKVCNNNTYVDRFKQLFENMF